MMWKPYSPISWSFDRRRINLELSVVLYIYQHDLCPMHAVPPSLVSPTTVRHSTGRQIYFIFDRYDGFRAKYYERQRICFWEGYWTCKPNGQHWTMMKRTQIFSKCMLHQQELRLYVSLVVAQVYECCSCTRKLTSHAMLRWWIGMGMCLTTIPPSPIRRGMQGHFRNVCTLNCDTVSCRNGKGKGVRIHPERHRWTRLNSRRGGCHLKWPNSNCHWLSFFLSIYSQRRSTSTSTVWDALQAEESSSTEVPSISGSFY